MPLLSIIRVAERHPGLYGYMLQLDYHIPPLAGVRPDPLRRRVSPGLLKVEHLNHNT